MAGLAGKTGKASLGIMISRILGLCREQVFAFLLGAGKFSDAFIVAFRIPNLLRDLFAEGALSTAFIPIYSDLDENSSKEKAMLFANLVINFILLVLGAIVILGIIFSFPLVRVIAPGFYLDPEKFALTGLLVKIIMPFILFMSLAAVVMGILNAKHKFFIPAVAPGIFNIVGIAAGFIAFFIGANSRNAVIIWTIGALVGGFFTLVFQLIPLVKLGYKYKPVVDLGFKNPSMKRLLFLIAPSVIGLAATQLNVFINTIIASGLQEGAVSWLNYGFRLIMLPIGVFGVAIATVNTVFSSRSAAKKDLDGIKSNLAESLKLNFFLSLASTAGLIAAGSLIVKILYQHGRFTPLASENTYYAVVFYCVGLFAYSSVKIIAPVFFALSNSRIPMISTMCAVAANLIVSFSTYKTLGFKGLALGTSVAALINYFTLTFIFHTRYGGLKGYGVLLNFFKTFTASVAMAGIVFLFSRLSFIEGLTNAGLLKQVLALLLIMTVGTLAYGFFCSVLRINEMKKVMNLLNRVVAGIQKK